MKIAIVYVHPQGWLAQAAKFLHTYADCPPGMEHESVVTCNGFEPDGETKFLFGSLPNLTIFGCDNNGYDISSFQLVASMIPADLMIFFGAHAYFRRAGWLPRVVESFHKYGDQLYGAAGHQGVGGIHPHIRTTGFWCTPQLMNEYPVRVTHPSQRYEFEHGQTCLTSWVTASNRRAMVVCWEGEMEVYSCNSLAMGYQQGDQRNLIFGDRMTCPPFYPHP